MKNANKDTKQHAFAITN